MLLDLVEEPRARVLLVGAVDAREERGPALLHGRAQRRLRKYGELGLGLVRVDGLALDLSFIFFLVLAEEDEALLDGAAVDLRV